MWQFPITRGDSSVVQAHCGSAYISKRGSCNPSEASLYCCRTASREPQRTQLATAAQMHASSLRRTGRQWWPASQALLLQTKRESCADRAAWAAAACTCSRTTSTRQVALGGLAQCFCNAYGAGAFVRLSAACCMQMSVCLQIIQRLPNSEAYSGSQGRSGQG